MTRPPGERIASLESDVKNICDDIRELQKTVNGHSALIRWAMGAAAGVGAAGTLLIKRISEALGL